MRRRWATFGVCAAIGMLVPAARPATAATRYLDPTFVVDVQRDLTYGSAVTVDGQRVTLTLDLYLPRGDTLAARPVFVFAHGGFFFLGTKGDGDASRWATQMAQRGYVAASINYRLSVTPVMAPVDTDLERQEINDARADMQTAVRWVRANATQLKIDPDRIAVAGSSAGAVTALGTALNYNDPGIGENANFSSAVCTAVVISGANDPLVVDPGDAGAIFHHGADDLIVPYELAVQTRDAMIANGLAVQWNEYAGEGHIFSAAAQALISSRSIQWLYDHVATAAYPCSAAVGHRMRVGPGQQTSISGAPQRSGVVSLIAVDGAGPGYLQVLDCGVTPGASSNLNLDRVGQIRSVLAIVRFGGDGRSCLYNEPRAHLVADVQGYFAVGAFDDVPDQRLLDTRLGPPPAARSQTIISGRPKSTAVISLVATNTSGPGYIQVLECGAAPGLASNVNADQPNQTRATLAFARFDAAGQACIYNETSVDLVVDLQGYMANSSFDDLTDQRLLDTRLGPTPGEASQTQVRGRPNATAVVSVVATNSRGPGYVQFVACGTQAGAASNLNTDAADQTVAGLAFIHFDAAGTACVFSEHSTDLVVDLQGYMNPGAFDDIADVRVFDSRSHR